MRSQAPRESDCSMWAPICWRPSVAVEALAYDSASAGVALALHSGVLLALGRDDRFTALARGEIVGAIALSTDHIPTETDGRLPDEHRSSGRCPITESRLSERPIRRTASSPAQCRSMRRALRSRGRRNVRASGLRRGNLSLSRRRRRICSGPRSVHDARAHSPRVGWARNGTAGLERSAAGRARAPRPRRRRGADGAGPAGRRGDRTRRGDASDLEGRVGRRHSRWRTRRWPSWPPPRRRSAP